MHSSEKHVRYVMSHIFRAWRTSAGRLLAHLTLPSSCSTPGRWLCRRGACRVHSSSGSVRHQTVAAAPGTRCSSTPRDLCSPCRTGDMQCRSARGTGGPAARGERVHLMGPRSVGRVKHTSCLSPVGWDSNQSDTGSCRCHWSM